MVHFGFTMRNMKILGFICEERRLEILQKVELVVCQIENGYN